MKTLEPLHHKKNEIQQVEFFKDEEYTEDFDFTNAKNLYIEFVNGDVTPLFYTQYKISSRSKIFSAYIPSHLHSIVSDFAIENKITVCTFDYASQYDSGLSQITPNLSKYIPEDNAVLFLSNETNDDYKNVFFKCGSICISFAKISVSDQIKWLKDGGLFHNKITIFLHNGTQSELQKANEVAKELKEKYGVEEVNLFALHCFAKELSYNGKIVYYEEVASSMLEDAIFCNRVWDGWNVGTMSRDDFSRIEDGDCDDVIQERANLLFNIIELGKTPKQIFDECKNHNFTSYKAPTLLQFFNKIITTNSTGILPVQDKERLQVVDAKEIFEEYLETQR